MKLYAGIGSRQTPLDVLRIMRTIGQLRAEAGWTLRSGAAAGADSAFEAGVGIAATLGNRKQIFRPTDPVAVDPSLRAIAMKHHPNWAACSDFARRAHTRNVAIILGPDGHTPVEEVLFWTERAQIIGGTGMALRLAIAYHIPARWISPTADPNDYISLGG